MRSSRTFFWWVGGEESGSQLHQPSLVPTGLGSTSLWAARSCLLPPGGGFGICRMAQSYFSVHPWRGTRTLPQGRTVVSCLFLPYLRIPSLPWLASVWICSLELREGHGGWMKPVSCNQKMRGTGFVPRNPTRCVQYPKLYGNRNSCAQDYFR